MKRYEKPVAEIIELVIDDEIMAPGGTGSVISDNDDGDLT